MKKRLVLSIALVVLISACAPESKNNNNSLKELESFGKADTAYSGGACRLDFLNQYEDVSMARYRLNLPTNYPFDKNHLSQSLIYNLHIFLNHCTLLTSTYSADSCSTTASKQISARDFKALCVEVKELIKDK